VVSAGAATPLVRGAFNEEGTFPFRFRRWLFALAGKADELAPCRPRLLDDIPDFLRRSAKGDSAAMAIFFTFLARLREAGRFDDTASDVDELTAARALAGAVGAAQRVFEGLGQPMPGLAAVVSNGRVMAALRRGHPLHLHLHEGIFGCARCELPADAPDNDPKVRAHRMLKAVVLASGAEPQLPDFRALEEGEVVAVGRGLSVRRV
jgi:glutamine amidotransferase